MSQRRALEKKLVEIGSSQIWTPEDLRWLSQDERPKFVEYARVALELMAFYGSKTLRSEVSDETTTIGLDVVRDLLMRINLLKNLLQDQMLKQRADVKEMMNQWQPSFKSIDGVIQDLLNGLNRIINTLIEFSEKGVIQLSSQENSQIHTISTIQNLEKLLINIGSKQIWKREALSWLSKSRQDELKRYIEAASNLETYYLQQVTTSDINSHETTVIHPTVLRDLLIRINLLKALRQSRSLPQRKDIKSLMSQWQPAFNSIYDLIQHYLDRLEQILNTLIEAGVQRIAYLDAQNIRRT